MLCGLPGSMAVPSLGRTGWQIGTNVRMYPSCTSMRHWPRLCRRDSVTEKVLGIFPMYLSVPHQSGEGLRAPCLTCLCLASLGQWPAFKTHFSQECSTSLRFPRCLATLHLCEDSSPHGLQVLRIQAEAGGPQHVPQYKMHLSFDMSLI